MIWYLTLLLIISIVLQLWVFAIAYVKQTDKLTDIAYGLGFIALNTFGILYLGSYSWPSLIIAGMITLWGIRISTYLFIRIHAMGRDKRFDGIREKGVSFLKFFLLQGVAIWAISIPSLTTYYTPSSSPDRVVQYTGVAIFLVGLALEAIADYQKFTYKQNGGKKWMSTGVWKYSRHPNYFGEMLVWWGIYCYTLGTTTEFWLIGLVGPIFITIILRFVTGIPPLEKRYAQKYQGNDKYEQYKTNTNVLIPLPKLR